MTESELLTPAILENIQRGNAVLFLGAGAMLGAKGPANEVAPTGAKLRDMLSDRFLGGELKAKSLAQVAEYAKNEDSLPAVQKFIRDVFNPLRPAKYHLLVPTFRWYGIVSTNFDLVLERAYEQSKTRQQILAPIIQDGERFAAVQRDPTQVPYLKLHGCITHIADPGLPLILASEEYAKHRKNRERLFRHFQDWARERTVIFCGYEIEDSNIQQILFDLTDLGLHRPAYGLVNPGLTPIATRYWQGKRFVVYPGTFEQFLQALDSQIPAATRTLAALVRTTESSIQSWVKTHNSPSIGLLKYLQDEVQHVYKGMPTSGAPPGEFYRGMSIDWGVLQQDLDVRRRLADDLILDAFLEGKEKPLAPEMFLVKGHAGSGKSVTLRRITWDLANDYDGFVFFLREGGLLRREHLQEIFLLTGQRIYLVIEDCIPHIRDIRAFIEWAEKNKVPTTLICGARTNEWNVHSGDLDVHVKGEYELSELTEREIHQLLDRLATHRALGRLANATQRERFEHFQLSAERQLLVALHDVSGDKPFEEIVLDEYRNIIPSEARILYLDICTLHRLGIGVRAGLISRISGITFEYFQRDFFRPLEHVVKTYFDHGSRDNMYRSRHRQIAEMVFKQALIEPPERAEQIVRIIRNMDVDYSSDEMAFRQMLRGRELAELFGDKSLGLRIFAAALESGAPKFVVEHQRAVFEMNHPGGNLSEALKAVERAEASLDHVDRAILHTKAAVLRELALASDQKLVRAKFREDAKSILTRHIGSSRVPHPFNTVGHILLDELREKLEDLSDETKGSGMELRERAIAEIIRDAEQVIHEGLQRFPEDGYLLTLEASLARILQDEKRALAALVRAFENSPGRGYVAVRYAGALSRQGDREQAISVLRRSIKENAAAKETHLALAKMLLLDDEVKHNDDISYHLKRSFTPGDTNLDAQYWWARQQFLYGDRKAALASFRELANTWVPAEYRNSVRGIVKESDGKERWFSGAVKTMEDRYCYINCPDLRFDIFAHANDFRDGEWQTVSGGSHVLFVLGFNFRGPCASRVRLT